MKYKDSGVNIDRANRAKASIAKQIRKTWGPGVLSETGAFGGLFEIDRSIEQPVLVSSIDGVGTKLLVAAMAGRYDTVGQDLVNHCVNDILVQGAHPLFFLDYLASGRLRPEVVEQVIAGISAACRENSCAVIGGETAEMPGIYDGEDFDLAGCIVGVVAKAKIIDGSTIEPDDLVFALPSNGLHTNGYSLARRVVFDVLGLGIDQKIDALGCTVGDELLRVHRSYLSPVLDLMKSIHIKGLAHITGGGVVENLPRILPKGCAAVIRGGTWRIPPVFGFLQSGGDIDEAEMYRVFNMGLGMIVVVSPEDRAKVEGAQPDMSLVGEITRGDRRVDVVRG